MELIVHGRNVEINDWIREYVEKKVDKLERYLPQIDDVRAELSHSPTRAAADRFTAQITIWTGGHNGQILRAEESTSDIFASIDAAVDKIAGQIRRFKGRRYKSKRRAATAASAEADLAVLATALEDAESEEETGAIIRRKQFLLQAMDEEEAIEQMELLGHDFFVYLDPDTNSTNVVYRRKDGNYGLLLPQRG
ncbi:MAG: ribosome-associated translation inhibitor RaiA [Caldilineaceae bacterium]|nr:ribosome-associated translation inhibitor RaiA [Caldilineaceae bacterium]